MIISLLRWPLSAVLVWALAWSIFILMVRFGVSMMISLGFACVFSVMASVLGQTWWRRLMIALGFVLSLTLSGIALLPAWVWLLPLLILLLIYPINAWRDAPLFPTPAGALQELASHAPLPEGATILDAGCGLGHGLEALRSAYPLAQYYGLEFSWPLRVLCSLRCPWANIKQSDIWRENWSGYSMVYLFQRPESMARAVAKARTELQPGAWLVSLEFEATELQAHAVLKSPCGRKVWVYRQPLA